MTEKEIRKQIEEDVTENACQDQEPEACGSRIACLSCDKKYLINLLVKERMISAAKQETIENLILGEREP